MVGEIPQHLLHLHLMNGLARRSDPEAGTYPFYVGFARAGTPPNADLWAIMRVTKNGTEEITEWANGRAEMENVWTNRTNLSYS